MAPVSRKEGLVSSPGGGQTEPEARALATGCGKGSFIFHGGTAVAGWPGPREVTACQMAWAPGRDKVERRGITAFLLPCLWLRGPSTVGLRHKSPRGRWPQPS